MIKICPQCKIPKELEENFRWRNKTKGTRQSWCKTCMTAYDKKLYDSGNKKLSTRESQKKLRDRNRQYVYNLLAKSLCLDCGNADIRVLEFDHRADKEFGIARMMSNCNSIEAIQNEINKCDIVCANCHRIRTYARNNAIRHQLSQI